MFENEIEFIRSLFPEKIKIPLHEPCFIGNEKKYINSVLDSTFVSSVGHYVNQFEDLICSFTGACYASAMVNGTCALHTALCAIGVSQGHEVITQPLTFIATANAISYCGATPLFIDVDLDTLGLSAKALGIFLEKNTFLKEGNTYNKKSGRHIVACVPVHIFGHPCRIEEIVEICQEYNIKVVEDCAESLGSFYKGKQIGRYGCCSIFSLNGNKIITSGGGGVVITDDENLANKIKHISTTAKVQDSLELIHDEIGFNYRMPNLNAALACAQMENLHSFIGKKRKLASEYQEFFKGSDLAFFVEPGDAISIYWLNAVKAQNKKMRDLFLKESHRAGIMTRPVWRLLNKLDMYKYCQTDSLKNASWLEERIVNIPSSVRL